jgi:hypothetical protein
MIEDRNKVLSDLVIDSVRLLILISKFDYKKTFKLTLDKIMLYDFYLKFPNTMFKDNKDVEIGNIDFFEYYSYYHWKPRDDQYVMALNYLISKQLILRKIENNKFYYLVSELGIEFVSDLTSEYKLKLDKIATIVKQKISKLSDEAVENQILEKIKFGKRYEG